MHAYTVHIEAKLKEPILTSCSTCELHASNNLELAHYVDRLQDENDELRKLMGWLSGHEPQLRIMIETYKRQDGEGLGANKVGEGSGENIREQQKTHHKNVLSPKPNHLTKRLDTTPACHTCFPKKTQVHLICGPGSVYTHMIDKMSEISLTVFKSISKFNHLLHSCGRLEGL
jgi:hypothetical protein